MDLGVVGNASVFVKFSMLVSAAPLVVGILHAVRPTERRLALMRPLSLAAIFASVSSLLLGVANALVYMGRTAPDGSAVGVHAATILAEAVIPGFVGFACLTAAWLFVAIAVRKSG